MLFLGVLLFCLPIIALGQTALDFPNDERKIDIEKSNPLNRFTADLQSVYKKAETIKNGNAREYFPEEIRIRNNMVLVDLIAKSSAEALQPELVKIDFRQTAAFGKLITGWINIDGLSVLLQMEELKYARPCYAPIKLMGDVDSQGDSAQYSKQARLTYNLDGSGIKIGILSDSYNSLNGAAAGVASGDLPGLSNPNGYNTPVTIVQDYLGLGTDEARGMAEIIHDVAPGAELFARTAYEGAADFAQGILDLGTMGCDVIVDDMLYQTEPFFQDGIIAQAVDEVVTNGAVYFSAAGNSGRKSYEAPFEDSGFTIDGLPLHDFDPGPDVDYAQEVTIPAGENIFLTLQWDQPFGSLPNSVGSCSSDLDIRIYDETFSKLLTASSDANVTTGDPLEILNIENKTAADMVVNIVILHFTGLSPSKMKYVFWSNSPTIEEFDTQSGTIVGHANAQNAIACGAAAWYNTTAYGAANTIVNDFSSAGGSSILFDKIGNPIAGFSGSIIRDKPEVVGPDGANTTFFGTDIGDDLDSDPNFFGTSAAAAHLAGLAALILESGANTPADVLEAMVETADDLDDPNTGYTDTGFDFGTGNGMVQGVPAVEYFISSLPVELIDLQVAKIGDYNGLVSWTTANESNNHGFIIEWKDNRNEFRQIAMIAGKGNTNEPSNYQFVVNDLGPGIHYFRLKQMDLDGRIENLGVVNLKFIAGEHKIWTYRNFEDQAIAVISLKPIEYLIQVFNVEGRLMYSTEDRVESGERKITEWSISNWKSGVYFYTLQFKGNDDMYHQGRFFLSDE